MGKGGFEGRPLRRFDQLKTHDTQSSHQQKVLEFSNHESMILDSRWVAAYDRQLWVNEMRTIRVCLSELGQARINSFVNQNQPIYQVLPASDRMGIRISNEHGTIDPVPALHDSTAVFPGAIQLPPNGKPIILMADAQPTGGYPILGWVIRADLGLLAALSPGDRIRFEPVSFEAAVDAWLDRLNWLKRFEVGFLLKR